MMWNGSKGRSNQQAQSDVNVFRVLVVLIVITLVIFFMLNREYLTVETIMNLTPGHLLAAAVAIILFYGVKSISYVFPITVLKICSGLIFGPFWGILVNVLGEALCVTLPFFLARFVLPNATQWLFSRYPRVEYTVNRYRDREFLLSCLLRTMTIFPVDVVSSALGLMKLNFKKYFFGSLLGMLPATIAVTCFGNSIRDPGSPEFFIAMGFTILFSLSGTVLLFLLVRGNRSGYKKDMQGQSAGPVKK